MILENSSNPPVKKYQIPIVCLWRKGKKTSPALAYDEHDGNVLVMDGHLVYGDFGTMTSTLPSWYCRGYARRARASCTHSLWRPWPQWWSVSSVTLPSLCAVRRPAQVTTYT